MTAPTVYRVFIASPGDVDAERELARHCVQAVNAELAANGGPTFELVGWEIVRGTAQRPQEAINELIDTCDYLLCLFKRDWGSDPGGALGYTSGTEEELFTALLGLGRDDHKMRDVWLAFLPASDVRPEVTELKQQIRDKHALLYEGCTTTADFQEKLSDRLRGWAQVRHKDPRLVDLVPRSGRDVLGADRLRRRGEQLVELGHPDHGAAVLEQAVALGGAPEKLALARLLARQGKLGEARDIVHKAVDELVSESPMLESPSVAEAYAYEANLLRRERKYFDAKQRLTQALGLLHADDDYTSGVRCRILDELGLAHHGAREYSEAIQRFEESRAIRLGVADDYLLAQSEINLARAHLALGDLSGATTSSDAAIRRLKRLTPRRVHANAYLLRAQVYLREGNSTEAVANAGMSLTLNQQLSNPRGVAMSHNVLAQAYSKVGNQVFAQQHAKACVEANAAMGSAIPKNVLRILAEVSG